MLLATTAIGAVWGAIFGYAAHWSTRGRREFFTVQTLEAQRRDVFVRADAVADAHRYLEPS
ncbi:hypothetical protein ACH47B_34550 [Rhodococcus sp. NPDC019627]|uniref:hypothetical protein n=1 Tax=unclassified Rhodococcus (in: high G+C Gram-positive bacteria) TaxID=192944 RepID=UPI0033F06003